MNWTGKRPAERGVYRCKMVYENGAEETYLLDFRPYSHETMEKFLDHLYKFCQWPGGERIEWVRLSEEVNYV